MTTPEQLLMAKGRRQILSDYAQEDAALKKREDEDRWVKQFIKSSRGSYPKRWQIKVRPPQLAASFIRLAGGAVNASLFGWNAVSWCLRVLSARSYAIIPANHGCFHGGTAPRDAKTETF
jgi:hypothetical protein